MTVPSKAPCASPALRVVGVAMLSVVSAQARAQAALDPVVVTGTRFVDQADNQPIGISVISAEQIRRGGYTTINEAVMRQLGVPGRLDLNGGGEYALDLRGFGSTSDNNMAIVVDGIRISEGDLGGTRLAGIPIETVERIEVLRGSSAVLYGEGATAGAIVITTKAGRGVARADQAQVFAAGGTQGRRELRGAATVNAGDFSFDLGAQRRLADNHRDNFASAVSGVSLAGQWQLDGLRVVARHAVDSLATGLPGALSTAEFAADPGQASSLTDHGRIDARRSTVTGEYKSGDWELALDLGTRHKELRSINFGFPFDYDVDATTAGLRARHVGRIAGLRNQVRFGFDHARWERDVLPIGTPDVQRNRGVYVKNELTLANGSSLSAGLRREKVDKDANTFAGPASVSDSINAWELGVVHPVTAQTQLYARLGTSFRLPNADELSNANLRPQTSRDVELGTRWRGGDSRVEARVYRSRLTDEIAFDLASFQNVNFDRTRRTGVEFEARHGLSTTVDLRAAGALRRSRFDSGANAGRDVPLAARRNASVGANWQFLPQHHLAADAVYTGVQFPTADNSCRIEGATTLDLRYAWRLPKLELSLAVANAGDRKYTTQAFGCAAGQVTSIYPEPGRGVLAAARMSF
jgi:iron complex outermembrane recepter protein